MVVSKIRLILFLASKDRELSIESTKRLQNALLACSLKNDRMISVRFQGKPFNIMVIQVYAPTTDAEKLKLNGSMKTYKIF